MKTSLVLTLCLASALSMHAALGQNTSTMKSVSGSTVAGPVAYVYVSGNNNKGGSPNQVEGFAAAWNGALTPLPGSPFAADLTGMVLNGKYLFGFNNDGPNEIDSYSIGWNGALKLVAKEDTFSDSPYGCMWPGSMILDHTGANLYVPVTAGEICDSTAYLSYFIEEATGQLKYLAHSQVPKYLYNWPLTFTGNNVFAYGSECIYDYRGGVYVDTFTSLQRKSDGTLNDLAANVPTPAAKYSDSFYCRGITAADPANHIAVAMQAINRTSEKTEGWAQIGTYSADKYGNLYTNSTYANMPVTEVGTVSDMSMAPSGKLLAVVGDGGLQIFRLDADDGIRHYTDLLTHDNMSRVTSSAGLVFWDNADHLYAISPYTNKLYVFHVTETSVSEAPGSPYTVALPQNIAVLPRTTLTPSVSPADGDLDKD